MLRTLRSTAYRLPFTAVALGTCLSIASWLPAWVGVDLVPSGVPTSIGAWSGILQFFAHPIPRFALAVLPPDLGLAIFLPFAALVFRRIYLSIRSSAFSQPPSYNGVPFLLLVLSSASIVLGLVTLVMAMVVRTAFAFPAVLFLGAAALLSPLAVALGEVKALCSFR